MADFDKMIAQAQEWMGSARFEGITRLHSARQVALQQGTIDQDYTIARRAAEDFYARLRELHKSGKSITTFGPYSPGQAVTMKRMGIEGIYLGGWATSAKGSVSEDPGADLASYPLSQVPDEAAPIVRALLAADKNQHYTRSRMTEAERKSTPARDFRPFIIADADTGHGGDAHVRNLIRRFVEAGVPGYHIEDQKPGLKKCGHQGGKVLVSIDEQIKRLNAARFQLDVMRVPGIIVARTDAESASLLDNRNDERDQPFILGATNVELPSYKICYAAILTRLAKMGVDEILGHHLFSLSDEEHRRANAWFERTGLDKMLAAAVDRYKKAGDANVEPVLDNVVSRFLEAWEAESGIKTFAQAVADVIEFGAGEGRSFDMTLDEWHEFARSASTFTAREKARSMGIKIIWSSLAAVTPEGFFQVKSGIDYAIAKSLAVAPFADILWMETKTANLEDAAKFADAIHAKYPDQMLAYNLSPSFNWDTTGMSDEEMKRFPAELGKLGYVFNFITYGGHQIDGLAAEDFAIALKDDGMLALARLQRKFRLVDSPYRTPQTLVGGPRLDGALMASSGRTATTKSMGKGSTQFQHLVQTEVPRALLEGWLEVWRAHYDLAGPLTVKLRPHTAGTDLLELSVKRGSEAVANVVFASMQDRRGAKFLSVRDQNTFEEDLRRKRLMTLVHLFLIHRYKATSVHYVSPTEDNQYQARKMKDHGLFAEVHTEIGQLIVASVDTERVAELLKPDSDALGQIIRKEDAS